MFLLRKGIQKSQKRFAQDPQQKLSLFSSDDLSYFRIHFIVLDFYWMTTSDSSGSVLFLRHFKRNIWELILETKHTWNLNKVDKALKKQWKCIRVLPSTYSMTIHRCRLVSNEQNMLTTNGFSAKVRMSRSTNACWIWFLRIRFCLLIFFIANRCRVSRWRTR